MATENFNIQEAPATMGNITNEIVNYDRLTILANLDEAEPFFSQLKNNIHSFDANEIVLLLESITELGLSIEDPYIIKHDIKTLLLTQIVAYLEPLAVEKFNAHQFAHVLLNLQKLNIKLDDHISQSLHLKTLILNAIIAYAEQFTATELTNIILTLAHFDIYLPNYRRKPSNDILYSLKTAIFDNFNRIASSGHHEQGFTHNDVARLCWSLGHFSFSDDDQEFMVSREKLLNLIIEYSQTLEMTFKPQEISCMIWSLPKLHISYLLTSPQFQMVILELIEKNVAEFSPQSISNILLGLSKINYNLSNNENLKRKVFNAIIEIAKKDKLDSSDNMLPKFIPQHVSNILTSVYKLGLNFYDPIIQETGLERVLLSVVMHHAPNMNAQGIANTLNSLSNLKVSPQYITPEFKGIVVRRIACLLEEFTLQGVVNTLRSFAKLGFLWDEIVHLELHSLLIHFIRNPNTKLKIQEATQIKFFSRHYQFNCPPDCQRVILETLSQQWQKGDSGHRYHNGYAGGNGHSPVQGHARASGMNMNQSNMASIRPQDDDNRGNLA